MLISNRILQVVLVMAITAGACVMETGCSSSPNSAGSKDAAKAPAILYENKLVRRPGDTPEDNKVYLVQNGRKRWVVNASWLAAHGFKFPEDVNVITPTDLEAIPTGEPIQ